MSFAEKEYIILDEDFIARFDGKARDPQKYKCLVIMPIGKEGTMEHTNNMRVFKDIINKCVTSCGYNIDCYRSDLINKSGAIDKQVIEWLKNDDIVIADLRRNNVNVTYELGIRHTFGKRSILVCSDQDKHLFFYTKRYRAIPYKIDGNSNQNFFKKLKDQIDDIIKNPEKNDNPVTDSIGDYVKGTLITENSPEVYLARANKNRYSLAEIYNSGNEDIMNLEITMRYTDKSNTSQTKKAVFIEGNEDPLFAHPKTCNILRQGEKKFITDFPRVNVLVEIRGIGVKSKKSLGKDIEI